MIMSSKFPSRVVVRMVNGSFTDGNAVMLHFEMDVRNDYYYIVFVNANGLAEVSSAELLQWFDQDIAASPMEYVNPRGGFTRVTARLMTAAEVQGALDAYRLFENCKAFVFPPHYDQKLKAAFACAPIVTLGTAIEVELRQEKETEKVSEGEKVSGTVV